MNAKSDRYKNLATILPWDTCQSAHHLPSVLGRVPFDCALCELCSTPCHGMLGYHTSHPRTAVTGIYVCDACYAPLHSLFTAHWHSLRADHTSAVPVIGRSLLLAANIIDKKYLRTNLCINNHYACEWCHTYHVNHALCQKEILWVLTHAKHMTERALLASCLPLNNDVQKIIVYALMRTSGDTYTPNVLDSTTIPDLRETLTSAGIPEYNSQKYGVFAPIFDKIMLSIARNRLYTVEFWSYQCQQFYASIYLAIIDAVRPEKNHVASIGWNGEDALAVMISDGQHFIDVSPEEYQSLPGLILGCSMCDVCSSAINFGSFVPCPACQRKRMT